MNYKKIGIALLISFAICVPALAAVSLKPAATKKAPAKAQTGNTNNSAKQHAVDTKKPSNPTADKTAKPAAQKPAAGSGPAMFGRQFQGLNLTTTQQQKIQKIMTDHRASYNTINKSNTKDADKAAKIKKLQQDTTTKIKGVLTAKQFQDAQKSGVLDRMLGANNAAGWNNGGGRNNSAGSNMRMYEQLNLTAQQKTKIQTIMQNQMKEMQAVRGDNKLTPAKKQTKMRTIQESNQKKIEALLTPAQKAKLQANQKNRQLKPRRQMSR